MSTLVIPPGYGQVSLRWTVIGDPREMISTFGVGDGSAPLNRTTALNISSAWIDTHDAASLGAGWTYVGLDLAIGQDGGPPVHELVDASEAGTSSVNTLPNNCALLVRKATSIGGRKGRGRMFLPSGYLQEGGVDSAGFIEAVYLANLRTEQTNFLNALFTIAPMVLLHSGTPLTPSLVNSLTADRQIATQRRRMR